jgi:hypothetical protein
MDPPIEQRVASHLPPGAWRDATGGHPETEVRPTIWRLIAISGTAPSCPHPEMEVRPTIWRLIAISGTVAERTMADFQLFIALVQADHSAGHPHLPRRFYLYA